MMVASLESGTWEAVLTKVGFMILGAAAFMELRAALSSTGEGLTDFARDYQRAARQFANLMFAASALIGFPLLAGGVAELADVRTALSWALVGLTSVLGATVLRWSWNRWPGRRLDGTFWDDGARVGQGGRRHAILVLAACLVFTLLCGALLLVAD